MMKDGYQSNVNYRNVDLKKIEHKSGVVFDLSQLQKQSTNRLIQKRKEAC